MASQLTNVKKMSSSMLGIYFIATQDIYGELFRWILKIPYNVIGVQIDSTLPGEASSPFIYFLDLFTLQSPTWISHHSMSYKDWTENTLYRQKGIIALSFRHFLFPDETLKQDIRKFIMKYCINSSTNTGPMTSHWRAIVSRQWTPDKNLSILSYALSPNHILFQDSSPVCHTHELSIFLSLMTSSLTLENNNQTQSYTELFELFKENKYVPIHDDMVIVSKSYLEQLDKHVHQWMTAIKSKSTPLIFLRDFISCLKKLYPFSLNDYMYEGDNSISSLIVFTDQTYLELPEQDMTTSFKLSLTTPDISLLTEDEKKILITLLHSPDYINNPKYDLVRKCFQP